MSDAGDVLSFTQRFKSVIGHTITPIFLKKLTLAKENEIFKKHFGDDFPDLLDVAANASLVFVNSNELYDLPRPTLHKIINIGGVGMKKTSVKPLPAEYSEKIEKSENSDGSLKSHYFAIRNNTLLFYRYSNDRLHYCRSVRPLLLLRFRY